MANVEGKSIKIRIIVAMLIVTMVFIGLGSRLYYIQIRNGEDLTRAALIQRGKGFSTYPNRGIIFDRNLNPITNNELEQTIIVEREKLLNNRELYENILNASGLSESDLEGIINQDDKLLQIPLVDSEGLKDLRDIFIVDVVKRYSRGNPLAHVIGYINKSDNSGRSGIERLHDEFLNIKDRESFIVEYDRDRKIVLGGSQYISHTTKTNDPTGVQLTIDIELQKKVESILDKYKYNGAVIVNEVDSGEILALASRPNFNQDRIDSYSTSDDMNLYNKALGTSGYPPGSIFKLVVLIAALEEDSSILETNYYCPGYEEVNGQRTNCSGVHGLLSLEDAFAKSCNSIFIQLGKKIGPHKIIDMARRLGFGSKVDIGLLEEIEGKLPEDRDLLGANIRNIAIGQGKIEVTPLQVNNLLTIIANKGIRKNLSIVKGITNNQGMIIKSYFKDKDELIISEDVAEIAAEYMRSVVNNGTAKGISLNNIGGSGGKTGSAEAVLAGKSTVHGWFSGFYPSQNPKYIITILIEDSKRGSLATLPIFEEIVYGIYNNK